MSRIFTTFEVALNEIKRDLAEMGTRVHTQTMQDKHIAEDEAYSTLELQNYIYTVTDPQIADLPILTMGKWIQAEWNDRLSGIRGVALNPGTSHKFRSEVWDEFLHDGLFSYTYSERLASCGQVRNIIDRLQRDLYSRQLYVVMWEAEDSNLLGLERVPCSLGWHFQYRHDRLDMTYFMRSCDFVTHFLNDIALSVMLQNYVAAEAKLIPGHFSHFMSSLHVYQKDVEGVF